MRAQISPEQILAAEQKWEAEQPEQQVLEQQVLEQRSAEFLL
jgi:hypothetical protein